MGTEVGRLAVGGGLDWQQWCMPFLSVSLIYRHASTGTYPRDCLDVGLSRPIVLSGLSPGQGEECPLTLRILLQDAGTDCAGTAALLRGGRGG